MIDHDSGLDRKPFIVSHLLLAIFTCMRNISDSPSSIQKEGEIKNKHFEKLASDFPSFQDSFPARVLLNYARRAADCDLLPRVLFRTTISQDKVESSWPADKSMK